MLTQIQKQAAEGIATHSLWGHPLAAVYHVRGTMQSIKTQAGRMSSSAEERDLTLEVQKLPFPVCHYSTASHNKPTSLRSDANKTSSEHSH